MGAPNRSENVIHKEDLFNRPSKPEDVSGCNDNCPQEGSKACRKASKGWANPAVLVLIIVALIAAAPSSLGSISAYLAAVRSAEINAEATKYSADRNYAGQVYVADKAAGAAKYTADKAHETEMAKARRPDNDKTDTVNNLFAPPPHATPAINPPDWNKRVALHPAKYHTTTYFVRSGVVMLYVGNKPTLSCPTGSYFRVYWEKKANYSMSAEAYGTNLDVANVERGKHLSRSGDCSEPGWGGTPARYAYAPALPTSRASW